jgi:protein MAK16
VCYLFLKTAERCHTPNKAWEKIPLDKSYAKALEQIDENIKYWPKFQIHKCKQRLTKIRQMLNRIRKLKLKGVAELIPIKKKTERREKAREQKALIAAQIETQIEAELLDRLKEGIYGEIYNVNKKAFEKVAGENEVESEEDTTREMELDSEDENFNDAEFIFDPRELDDEADDDEFQEGGSVNEDTLGDIEDFMSHDPPENMTKNLKKRKGGKLDSEQYGNNVSKKLKTKKPTVEVEYEEEGEKETAQEFDTNDW